MLAHAGRRSRHLNSRVQQVLGHRRRVRQHWGEDEAERLRNRTKSRTRARVEHAFLVLKRLWGFAKVRYRGVAKNANRTFTALAMVNLFMAARRIPALVHP
jgi:IS5 family transposase